MYNLTHKTTMSNKLHMISMKTYQCRIYPTMTIIPTLSKAKITPLIQLLMRILSLITKNHKRLMSQLIMSRPQPTINLHHRHMYQMFLTKLNLTPTLNLRKHLYNLIPQMTMIFHM